MDDLRDAMTESMPVSALAQVCLTAETHLKDRSQLQSKKSCNQEVIKGIWLEH